MYISPVVYPLSIIPEKWHYAASFNPMVGIIETARQIIFGSSSLESIYILNGLITTVIMLFLGLLIFNRAEKTFLDTVWIMSTIVNIENLYKEYRLGTIGYGTLREDLES